jgi:hypothetical protein
VEGRKKKNFKKNGNCSTGAGVNPRPASDRRSVAQGWPATSGRPPAADRHLRLWDSSNFFEIFLFKKKDFLEVWVMGQGF